MTFQVIAFRKKHDGSWTSDNLGYARESDKGGYDLTLFTIPAPVEGKWRIHLRPPRTQPQAAKKPSDEPPPF